MARAGRGEVHYILNQKQSVGAAERFYERVRTPVLTDVELQFDGVEVTELYPPHIPDLFAAKPVVVKGMYKQGGRGVITLKGNTGEGPFERKIDVTLPDERPEDDVLASLWARAKVKHLMGKNLTGIQQGKPDPAIKEEILGLGLRFDLLTQFTSFVAVEHVRITTGGQPRLVPVEVEMPEGVDYEGVFGANGRAVARRGGAMYFKGRPSAGLILMRQRPQQPAGPGAVARPTATKPAPAGPVDAAKAEEDSAADEPAAGEKHGDAKAHLAKLADELRGLAEKLAKDGRDGNLTVGKIEIKDGRIEVQVRLSSLSDQVIEKLKKLGFTELGRAKSVNLLIGTIEVKQLEALAKLDEVVRIEPSS
jgi:hypothetical protein